MATINNMPTTTTVTTSIAVGFIHTDRRRLLCLRFRVRCRPLRINLSNHSVKYRHPVNLQNPSLISAFRAKVMIFTNVKSNTHTHTHTQIREKTKT